MLRQTVSFVFLIIYGVGTWMHSRYPRYPFSCHFQEVLVQHGVYGCGPQSMCSPLLCICRFWSNGGNWKPMHVTRLIDLKNILKHNKFNSIEINDRNSTPDIPQICMIANHKQ
jgi:hypothetical protein